MGRSSALRLAEESAGVMVTGLYTEGGDYVRGMFEGMALIGHLGEPIDIVVVG